MRVYRYIKKVFHPIKSIGEFFLSLLSDDNRVSSRRFLALQSFYFIVYMAFIAMLKGDTPLANTKFLMQIEEHFFWITIGGMGFVTMKSLAEILISKGKSGVEDYYQGYSAMDIDNPNVKTE